MNYFELLKQFWRIDSEYPFQKRVTRLYFYSLNASNGPEWDNLYNLSDRYIATNMDTIVFTLSSAKIYNIKACLTEVIMTGKRSFKQLKFEI